MKTHRPLLAMVLFASVAIGAMVAAQTKRTTAVEPVRRTINLPGHTGTAAYSDAVLVGNTLYLSGKTGADAKTGKIPDDVEQEIRNILDWMKATLAAAGLTMDALVSVQVFCTDITLYDKFNAIWHGYFTKDLPARAFLGAGPLLHGARFEVQAIAVK